MGGGLSGIAHSAPGTGKLPGWAERAAAKAKVYDTTDPNGYTRERYENDAFGPTNAAFYGRLSGGSFFTGSNGSQFGRGYGRYGNRYGNGYGQFSSYGGR